MKNIPIPNPAEWEKLLAELDAVDFDDLDDGFRGVAVDDAQLGKCVVLRPERKRRKNSEG